MRHIAELVRSRGITVRLAGVTLTMAPVERVPIAEAVERLGVSRDTLERLIRAGRLKRYRRFGDRKTYVDLDEAKQVLDWREQ
jgi:excisionase family DNA binding protein